MRLNKLLYALLLVITMQGFSFAQEREVSGSVKDASGEPLFGAAVVVEGESKGTGTDMDGKFTIKVAPGKNLEISFLGMKTKVVKVGSSKRIDVVLEVESQDLDEFEMVGYATVKKDQYVGSASSVDKESLKRKSVSDVSQALAGEAAGVRVINTSGQPGSSATVRVRGFGSVNGNRSPLYVLDGVPFDGNLSSINPDDIESMTVLKDATSTSVYGSRGANGVVLITTKKGRANQSNIQVESKIGFNSRLLPRYQVISSPEEYAEIGWSAMRQRGVLEQQRNPSGFNAAYSSVEDYANKNLFGRLGFATKYNMWNGDPTQLIDPSTGKMRPGVTRKYSPENWADYAYQASVRTEYNLNISGGNDKTTYYTSLGFLDDVGYAINTNFKRYSGRVNVSHQAKPWLKGEFNLGYAHSKSRENGQTEDVDNLFWVTDNMPPIYPLFLRDAQGNKVPDKYFPGSYQYDFGNGRGFSGTTNAIAQGMLDRKDRTRNELNANVFFKVDFLKELSFETRLGGQYYNKSIDNVINPYYGAEQGEKGRITKHKQELLNYTFLQLLRYTQSFGNHNVQAFVAHESTTYDKTFMYGNKSGLVDPKSNELNSAIKLAGLNSYTNSYRLESYFGQVMYDYESRYLLSASLRRDGSSRFLNEKWGNFASAGIGWVVSREKFLENKKYLPYLKLKASYGTVGDQNIGYYSGYDVYDIDNFMNLPAATFYRIGYPDLTWEKSKIFQVGTEFTLLESRAIDVQLDYYHKTTDNLIFASTLAPSSGNNVYTVNDGLLTNSGLEFSVTGHVVNHEDFKLDLSLNGEVLSNKLTRMPIDNTTQKPKVLDNIGGYARAKDHSIYDFYMREYRGVNPNTGAAQYTMYYQDRNNNQRYDNGEEITSLYEFEAANPGAAVQQTLTETYTKATQMFVGKSAIPDVRGAITLKAAYKGFSFTTQWLYGLGGYSYDNIYANMMTNRKIGGNMWHADVRNRWQRPGDQTDVPRLSSGFNANEQNVNSTSTRFLTKSDYLALNNITLGYDLPKEVCESVGFSSLTFTLSGDNLWILTHRKGFNPTASEVGSSNRYQYAPLSTFTLGVRANF